MVKISLLGIPHDDNSSFMKGASEAPALIRRELHSDAYSMWSETGIDLSVAGRLVDHGDIQFDSATDPWDLIERNVERAMESGDPLICLGGDHAITHAIMRAVRRRHPKLTIGVSTNFLADASSGSSGLAATLSQCSTKPSVILRPNRIVPTGAVNGVA